MGHFPRSSEKDPAVWTALCAWWWGVCGGRGVTGPQGPLPSPAGSHSHAFTGGDERLLDFVPTLCNILGVQDKGQVFIQHLHESSKQLFRISEVELRLLEWKTRVMSLFPPLDSVPLNWVRLVCTCPGYSNVLPSKRSMFVHIQHTWTSLLLCV